MSVIGRYPPKGPHATVAPHEAVDRVKALLQAHHWTPLRLAELACLVGVSERGLRNAFYQVHGVAPKRSMLRWRLLAARGALQHAGITQRTVTSVATEYGLHELGRFAGEYRRLFGETPSETLRSARRARPHCVRPADRED